MLPQQGVKLRFDRPDRNEMAAGALIDAVEMRAAVEEVAPSLSAPTASGREVKEHRHQRGCTIAHRGVDHLALAGFAGFEKCGEHADNQIKRASAEIADQIERRDP